MTAPQLACYNKMMGVENIKKVPKYRRKFEAARVGLRCSLWRYGERHYGTITEKHFVCGDKEKSCSYLRVRLDDNQSIKLTLQALSKYSSFRLELSGIERAQWRMSGRDYADVVKGGPFGG